MSDAISVCHDYERRTCIQVERSAKGVKYIPLDVSAGLEVHQIGAEAFDRRFKPMVNYPIEKAALLYVSYSQSIGASKEALGYLGKIINISKREFEMATARKSKTEEKKTAVEQESVKKAKPIKQKAESVKSTAKPTASKALPAENPAKKDSGKKLSASQMFQDLIMEGKLTDDQIFAKVQEEFGLDEKKRGYVKWYRNHLKKQGANPPEPKVGK